MTQYLKTYLFEPFGELTPEFDFLLYHIQAKVSMGSFISSLVPCSLFITHDLYLMIETLEDRKVVVHEKIDNFKSDFRVKDKIITLNYTKKGVIFDSNKEIRLMIEQLNAIDDFRELFLNLATMSTTSQSKK